MCLASDTDSAGTTFSDGFAPNTCFLSWPVDALYGMYVQSYSTGIGKFVLFGWRRSGVERHHIITLPLSSGIRAVRRFVRPNCGAGAVKKAETGFLVYQSQSHRLPWRSRTFIFYTRISPKGMAGTVPVQYSSSRIFLFMVDDAD